jgi:toxin ParE1/3/4
VTYSLHRGTEQDIAGALDFYTEQAGVPIARRFLSEFEGVAHLLVEHPGIGTPTTKGRRVFPLRVFPYSVVYRSLETSIRIVVVRHRRKKPSQAKAGHGHRPFTRVRLLPDAQPFNREGEPRQAGSRLSSQS